jgi:hypothetical protein
MRVLVRPILHSFLSAVARELSNGDLFACLTPTVADVCFDNALPQFCAKMEMGLNCETERAFLCKHFEETWPSMREVLRIGALYSILSSDDLVIPSEDWLTEELTAFAGSDPLRLILFETVCFEGLSASVMRAFIDFIDPLFGGVPRPLWERLCRRLLCDVALPTALRARSPAEQICAILFKAEQPFQGIIAFLSRNHTGNLADCNAIDATASSADSAAWGAKWCIDPRPTRGFCSTGAQGGWLALNFKDRSVRATHYSILSRDQGRGFCHPRSWVAEVCDDGQSWVIVDRRENDDHLNGKGLHYTFEIPAPMVGHYFRLRQTGPTHRNDHYFTFTNLELFGDLRQKRR